MTVLITLTVAGLDATIFDLYSDIDGFTTPFETDIPVASLIAGYSSSLVPDYTSVIRIQAKEKCVNYIDIVLENTTTTTSSSTTTTTSSSSTTTTTTSSSTSTTTSSSTSTTTTTSSTSTTTTTTTATPTTTTTSTTVADCNCWQIVNNTDNPLNVDYIDCFDTNLVLSVSPSGGSIFICVKGTPTLDPGLDSFGPGGSCTENGDCNI